MKITEEWLDKVQDELGYTRGQEILLNRHTNGAWLGKEIPAQVAHWVETCKGYRGMPSELKEWIKF